ncbi:hypothetical protein OAD67_02215 [bacterium]|nr:hypothetical protein [bacterium]
MVESDADPFDLLQPIPAKPKPSSPTKAELKSDAPTLSPSASMNGVTPMGPGVSAASAQRDAMRDAIANKMDEMLGT